MGLWPLSERSLEDSAPLESDTTHERVAVEYDSDFVKRHDGLLDVTITSVRPPTHRSRNLPDLVTD